MEAGACAVSARRRRLAGLDAARRMLLLLLMAGVGLVQPEAVPAWAQSPTQGLGDLPAVPRTDPNIDPYPFDAFIALRNHFRQSLPGGWRAAEPLYDAGGYSLLVFVPDSWKGNPSSALQRYCPAPYSNLWRGGIRWIELKPFYKQAYWASALCRPAPGG